MAKYVNVASVLFPLEHLRGHPQARQLILEDTARRLDAWRGFGLDLVVLSEGIESLAQEMDQAEELARPGPILKLYTAFAAAEHCHVAGSVKLREGRDVYNSIAYIGPDGRPLGAYHKSFLTRSEIEMGMRPGPGAVVIDTAIGRLGGAICFDLNFAPLRDQYAALRPDILTFASMYHGGLAQAIWAYQCRAFLVSAVQFHGGGIVDPFGRPLALTDCYHDAARARINLDRIMIHMDFNRERFPEIERRYGLEVCLDIPANIGSALLYSLSDRRSALDIAREFKLVLLDDYLDASARLDERHRRRPLTARVVGRGGSRRGRGA
jgi:predicted amidohydrolase